MNTLIMSEIHEGQALKKYIALHDVSITDLAEGASMSRTNIYALYGRPELEDDLKKRISKALKTAPQKIFNAKHGEVSEPHSAYLTKHQDGIPLFPDYASAGTPNGFADALKDLPRYYVPGFQDCDLMVPVSGDSMYSDYSSGDIIICKKIENPTFIQWGNAYLVDTVQGLLLKYLYPSEKQGYIKFVSKNEKYPPFEMKQNKEAKRFFIVKGKIKKNLI